MKHFLIGLLVLSIGSPCLARYRMKRKPNAFWAVTTTYSSYTDIKMSSGSESTTLEPAMDLEIAMRLQSVFQFIVVATQSENSLREAYGAGFRIDLPGFFFLFSSPRQVRYSQKWQPITTSLYGQFFKSSNKATANGIEEDASGADMGFTIDTFLFNPYVYMRLQASVMNQQGNTFSTYTAGLGMEF